MLEAYLKLHHSYNEDFVFVSRDVPGYEGSKDFAFFPFSKLEQYINSLPEEQRYLYEVEVNKDTIKQRRKLKIDFDISIFLDKKTKTLNPDFPRAKELGSSIAVDLRKYMELTFKELWPEQILHEDTVLLFDSNTAEKVSYHAVINGFCVADEDQAIVFMRKLRTVQWEWAKFVDVAPYTSFQNFRLPKCHKEGKPNKKLTSKLPGGGYPSFLDSLTTYVRGCVDLPKLQVETKRPARSGEIKTSDEDSDRIMELFNSIEEYSGKWELRDIKNGLVSLRQLEPCWCPLCEREHDGASKNESFFLTLNEQGDVTLRCRRFRQEGMTGGELLFNLETGLIEDEEEQIKPHKRLLPKRDQPTESKGEKKHSQINFITLEEQDQDQEQQEWRRKALEYKQEQQEERRKDREYNGVKRSFEQYHFKCLEDGLFYDTESDYIITRGKTQMETVYQHLKYSAWNEEGKESRKPFLLRWLGDEHMRIHQRVRLVPPPAVCPPGVFNLWKGLAIEKHEIKERTAGMEDDLKFLMDHMLTLSNKDEKIFSYLKCWIAHMIQNPGVKPRVMLLIKSVQGLGKQLGLYTPLANILGRQYCLITQRAETDLLGSFNSMLENRLLVVMDEMSLGTSVKYEAQVKELITRETDLITHKGVNTKEVPSFGHYMAFSNKDFPWTLEDADRRYLAIDASSQDPLKPEYFTRLARVAEDMNVLRLFYEEMMRVDLKKWDARTSRPDTEFARDLKAVSRPLDLQFMIEFLEELKTNILEISAKELYTKFINYTVAQGVLETTHKITAIKFGMKIKQMKVDGWTSKKLSTGCMGYSVDFEKAHKWLKTKGFVESPVCPPQEA